MTPNRHKVPKQQWNKWSESARRVFNLVYEAMKHQDYYLHPSTARFPNSMWETTRWNGAFTAAVAVDNERGKKPKCRIADLYLMSALGGRSAKKSLRQAWSRGYCARMDQEP